MRKPALALALALAAAAAGCGGAGHPPAAPERNLISLRIAVAARPGATPAVRTLRCRISAGSGKLSGGGGVSSCAALAALNLNGRVQRKPPHCPELAAPSQASASISGSYLGARISRRLDQRDVCAALEWQRLSLLLGPARISAQDLIDAYGSAKAARQALLPLARG